MRRFEGSDMSTHGLVIGDRGECASDCIPEVHSPSVRQKVRLYRCGYEISNSGQRERLSIKKAYWKLPGA